ncbi:helix-turn-helix transcriptional regulator [Enterocloster clostridioformis]
MNNVKVYRKKENISLTELSVHTGVSERHLRFIENGDRTPSLYVAKKIADCLHSTVDDIFLSEKCTKST